MNIICAARNDAHLLSVPDSTSSLLSMATGELVSDLWRFRGPDSDFAELVALLIDSDHHLVNDARLGSAHEHTGVSLRESPRRTFQLQRDDRV